MNEFTYIFKNKNCVYDFFLYNTLYYFRYKYIYNLNYIMYLGEK